MHYRKWIIVAGLLPVLAGCTQMSEEGRRWLAAAQRLYDQGDTQTAERRLDRLINEFKNTPEVAEAYYLRGLCRTKKGALQSASEDFDRAIAKSRRSEVTARSQASLAAIAYRNGNWDRAAELYEQAVARLPDESPTDEILYHAGVAMQRAGRWRKAALQFTRILYKFGDRPIAEDARRMAGWQHEHFAIQLGAFSRRNGAESTASTFRSRGLDAVRVEHHPRAGQALWVVMCGEYSDYDDARAALAGVRSFQPDAYVIPQP